MKCVQIASDQHKKDYATTMVDPRELCAIVDEEDNVIGSAIRRDLRAGNLIHRASYVFVVDDSGECLFIHKRTETKDFCPGFFDVVSGGVVQFGEEYRDNAIRELEEEYGIRDPEMQFLGTKFYQDERCRVWGGIFLSRCNANVEDLTPQPEEVVRIELASINEILESAETGLRKFTPDSLHMLRQLVKDGILPAPAR